MKKQLSIIAAGALLLTGCGSSAAAVLKETGSRSATMMTPISWSASMSM